MHAESERIWGLPLSHVQCPLTLLSRTGPRPLAAPLSASSDSVASPDENLAIECGGVLRSIPIRPIVQRNFNLGWTMKPSEALILHRAVDQTPYKGMEFKAWPGMTISRGEVVWSGRRGEGSMHGSPPFCGDRRVRHEPSLRSDILCGTLSGVAAAVRGRRGRARGRDWKQHAFKSDCQFSAPLSSKLVKVALFPLDGR